MPNHRYRTGVPDLDAAIEALVEQCASHPDADLAREMVVTCLKLLLDEGADRGDMKQYNSTLKELRYATKVFAPYANVRKATVFGSARIQPDQPAYRMAVEFSRRIADEGWMVITGAGPGIMQAGNEGAGTERSFGVNIRLPFEQSANPAVVDSPNLITFKYFFTRKLFFVKESHAVLLFPGGFGTLDEAFETLTLIQTGKSHPVPVVMLEDPAEDYWESVDIFLREELLRRGLISEEDVHLYKVVKSVDAAVAEVLRFYRNFHSARMVRDGLLLRTHRPLDEDLRLQVQREARWIMPDQEGTVVVSEGPHPEERGDHPAEAPFRVHFPFDQRSFGRLRGVIDLVNDG